MGPIILARLETSTSTPQWHGPSKLARRGSSAGSPSTPESLLGTSGFEIKLTDHLLSEINSAIASYISTGLIPYLLKLSPGDRKARSQKYALEVRSSSGQMSRGSSFSFKFTIALCSKSQHIGGERLLLSIPLSDILKLPCLTMIPSQSSGG